jgi:hypothetical protein
MPRVAFKERVGGTFIQGWHRAVYQEADVLSNFFENPVTFKSSMRVAVRDVFYT